MKVHVLCAYELLKGGYPVLDFVVDTDKLLAEPTGGCEPDAEQDSDFINIQAEVAAHIRLHLEMLFPPGTRLISVSHVRLS